MAQEKRIYKKTVAYFREILWLKNGNLKELVVKKYNSQMNTIDHKLCNTPDISVYSCLFVVRSGVSDYQ